MKYSKTMNLKIMKKMENKRKGKRRKRNVKRERLLHQSFLAPTAWTEINSMLTTMVF